MKSETENIRVRLEAALAGRLIEQPIYAVYDWFVENRPLDWENLFEQGLGQVNHANLIRHHHPYLEIKEVISEQDGRKRKDVYWITDKGELHEWYLGEWRQEYFIKNAKDYGIMARALEDVKITPNPEPFLQSEAWLKGGGITLGQIPGLGNGRTPLMVLQIDWVGLEQFSLDLAYELTEMLELVEMMNEIKLEEIRQAVKTPAKHIKLWENLSIETLGPTPYRQHFFPLYKQILGILQAADKRLHVHYDGRLRLISKDIAALDIEGIDSFTEPPEGDMSVAEARAAWPDKFLWFHPNLGWYRLPPRELADNIRRCICEAEQHRYCLMISEEIPPAWETNIPFLLNMLQECLTSFGS